MATPPTVLVLGAGMSGICMGVRLKHAGIDTFTIIERSAGVGGTWWDNVYPGAQCDVRSHLYSFSFEPKADWSRVFAPSDEIQAYAEHCVDKYGLRPHLRLNTMLTAARFDPARALWCFLTSTGEHFEAQIFVCSVGPLSQPRWPAGIDSFRGEVMHSARWNAAYDFRGKRVALVGSAASAVQLAPPLAAAAERLTIFQRTPSWILPRPDRPYRTFEKRLLRLRPLARLHRWWQYWVHDLRFAAFRGKGLVHRLTVALADRHRRAQVQDPQLRERLRPRYPMGCKRILITSDFYPTLGRSNVELVDHAACGFTPEGVIAADGTRHTVDAIVCATGFAATELLAGIEISGTNGVRLRDVAAEGADAYRGVALPGFPNLFMLLGPNTGTGHTSVLIAIEAQARYALRCIQELTRRARVSVEVRADVVAAHNFELQRRLARTVWASPACGSWYKTAAGKVVALYPGHCTRYVLEMRRPRFSDFRFAAAGER
jgi:cation diffusion facilitator CzcD-associated flavoprotein CzcO